MRICGILVATLMFFSGHAQASDCETEVRYKRLTSDRDRLIISLLKLSLSKIDQRFCFVASKRSFPAARETLAVQQGSFTVKWGSGGPLDAKHLRPIEYPVFKGLSGYRVIVTRTGEESRFSSVKSVHDLAKFKAGMGASWGDRSVFDAAGLPMVVNSHTQLLWAMLEKGRYDYLAVGAHEPWRQLSRQFGKISVEPSLLIVYPMILRFYVSKENHSFYKALSTGMEKAIKDGSYDQLLYRSEMMRIAAERANMSGRKIIRLPNPNPIPKALLERSELWINPMTFEQDVRRANQKQSS